MDDEEQCNQNCHTSRSVHPVHLRKLLTLSSNPSVFQSEPGGRPTKNMIIKLSTAPAPAVHQVKYLKLGLKFGAELIFNKKQAKFVAKNVMR